MHNNDSIEVVQEKKAQFRVHFKNPENTYKKSFEAVNKMNKVTPVKNPSNKDVKDGKGKDGGDKKPAGNYISLATKKNANSVNAPKVIGTKDIPENNKPVRVNPVSSDKPNHNGIKRNSSPPIRKVQFPTNVPSKQPSPPATNDGHDKGKAEVQIKPHPEVPIKPSPSPVIKKSEKPTKQNHKEEKKKEPEAEYANLDCLNF
uniref:Smg4_UPF3 domain-containing protein n=1 Tax=Parastrongyloides trichosuri TaxID=131310 RepID=A0A0N4ZJT6_PARTI